MLLLKTRSLLNNYQPFIKLKQKQHVCKQIKQNKQKKILKPKINFY